MQTNYNGALGCGPMRHSHASNCALIYFFFDFDTSLKAVFPLVIVVKLTALSPCCMPSPDH